jgi:hypothetical protein
MPTNNNDLKKWSGQTEIPQAACLFAFGEAIDFAAGEEKDSVRLVGYRGDIIDHWFWGNLAFDMDGLRFAKKATPGLIDHQSSQRLTFAKAQSIKPEVFIAGPILDNEDAQKVKADMAKGFQFEASLSLAPTLVEQVAKGESVEVNGKMLRGPGAVFRKAAIKEISATVFGAFSNTESALYSATDEQVTFTLVDKEKTMSDKRTTELSIMDLTAENFAEHCPDIRTKIFDQGKAAGEKAERTLFTELKAACGENHALLVECFSEGKSVTDALKLRAEQAEAGKVASDKKLTALQQEHIDPATQEFTDAAPAPGAETPAAGEGDEASWRLEFKASKELQDEFRLGGVEAYIEVKKREAAEAA